LFEFVCNVAPFLTPSYSSIGSFQVVMVGAWNSPAVAARAVAVAEVLAAAIAAAEVLALAAAATVR
jgi:hypothetical protein